MAECAALLPCVHLGLQRSRYKASDSTPQNLYSETIQRSHIYGSYKLVKLLPSSRVHTISPSLRVSLKRNWQRKETSLRCFCLGMLTGPENVAPLHWVSVMDEVLLMASIIFAYMAGVVPRDQAFFNAQTKTKDYNAGATDSTTSGRSMKIENQAHLQDSWTEVNEKLMDALDAIEHDSDLKFGAVDCEYYSTKRPLSLFALAEGPRLRLLLATLQRLHREVNNISQVHEFDSRDVWLVSISKVLQGSIQPICVQWLEEELILEHKEQDEKNITRMFEKLKGDDSMTQYIRRTGKTDLYADLLFFFRFGFLSTGFCYDNKLLIQHGVEILEDLVITMADGISGIYLELISVDSNMSSEMNGLGLTLCSMSTRALQKLRNEVALNLWLQQNFESVVSMYEDRFELCILRRKLVEGPSESQTKKLNWWKKLAFRKQATSSPLRHILISQLSMPIKRTKELRALTGWTYYFSLFLEFSDIAMPLVRAIFTKVSNAVSFFLVYLIGRSLGLIYTGIRQSLGWR